MKNWDFWQKHFQQGHHICILDIQRNVLKKKDFFARLFFKINFVLTLAEKYYGFIVKKKDWQGCQNYVLRVQGNVLRNITGGKIRKDYSF